MENNEIINEIINNAKNGIKKQTQFCQKLWDELFFGTELHYEVKVIFDDEEEETLPLYDAIFELTGDFTIRLEYGEEIKFIEADDVFTSDEWRRPASAHEIRRLAQFIL